MHFEVQFYGRRKNSLMDACGRAATGCAIVHPSSNVYKKECTKKLNLYPES